MRNTEAAARRTDRALKPRGVDRALWFGLLAGPSAALADTIVSHSIVEAGAERWPIYLVTAAAVVITLAGALCAWRGVVQADLEPQPRQEPRKMRMAFMGYGGLLISAFSLLVILATLIPKIALRGDVAI